jgi:glyoxylase I family protein
VTEILGLDHIYVSVADIEESERFYDRVMKSLGFRKGDKAIGGEPHLHYFNRHFQYTIRPAHRRRTHDPYAPGLHHVCFQVADADAVDAAYRLLLESGVAATAPALYPEYAPDYYATFFEDPDGLRLEIVARTHRRRLIAERWPELEAFLNPLDGLSDASTKEEEGP